MDKIHLSRILSKLDRPSRNILGLEQYVTDVSAAVDFLFFVDAAGMIESKDIADLGCGTGILGLGAGLLGAKHVDMYDIDKKMLEICTRNVASASAGNCSVHDEDLFDVLRHYDVVISNPPFGFQSDFDIETFILHVRKIADNFFFLYKDNHRINGLSEKYALQCEHFGDLHLDASAPFHRRRRYPLPAVIVYSCKG
jgi:putative methylase